MPSLIEKFGTAEIGYITEDKYLRVKDWMIFANPATRTGPSSCSGRFDDGPSQRGASGVVISSPENFLLKMGVPRRFSLTTAGFIG
jgi:hypothetical protein